MEAERDAQHNVTASRWDGRNGTPVEVGIADSPRMILREAYDIWGNSLGFVLFTVPANFESETRRQRQMPRIGTLQQARRLWKRFVGCHFETRLYSRTSYDALDSGV